MSHVHGRTERHATGTGNNRCRVVDGTMLGTPVGPISRVCPRCEAPIGRKCRRWIGGRIRGKDVGGGYWRTLSTFHYERKLNPASTRVRKRAQ